MNERVETGSLLVKLNINWCYITGGRTNPNAGFTLKLLVWWESCLISLTVGFRDFSVQFFFALNDSDVYLKSFYISAGNQCRQRKTKTPVRGWTEVEEVKPGLRRRGRVWRREHHPEVTKALHLTAQLHNTACDLIASPPNTVLSTLLSHVDAWCYRKMENMSSDRTCSWCSALCWNIRERCSWICGWVSFIIHVGCVTLFTVLLSLRHAPDSKASCAAESLDSIFSIRVQFVWWVPAGEEQRAAAALM